MLHLSRLLAVASIALAPVLAQTTDLGGGLGGSDGIPLLQVTPAAVAKGEIVSVSLSHAAPNSVAVFVAGWGLIYLPLFGGILVPTPEVTAVVPTDSSGVAQVSFPWDFNAGTSLYLQYVVVDAAAVEGFAFSNAVQVRGFECVFRDLDGGTRAVPTEPLFHGSSGGYFVADIPTPTVAAGGLDCVWALYSNGNVVDIPQHVDFMRTSFVPHAPGSLTDTVRIPYSLATGGGADSRPYSYNVPGAGAYRLHLWVGQHGVLAYSDVAPPSSGIIAEYDVQFDVVQPEVSILVPSRNSLTAGSTFAFRIHLTSPASQDRYFTVSGTGGIVPSQGVAVIPAQASFVDLGGTCYYPAGRLVAVSADVDGSAVGGDDFTNPGQELYVSQYIAPVETASVSGPADSWWGPYYGEVNPRPSVGDAGAGTECIHSGGVEPNPTGMPTFKICGPCKFPGLISGDDRTLCKDKVPGSSYPIISEPICSPATKFKYNPLAGQHGPGGQQVPDPDKHCVVTETMEPVKVYKLDGSTTEECFFVGGSIDWLFFGMEVLARYCCVYSNVDDDAQQVPVRRCTTV